VFQFYFRRSYMWNKTEIKHWNKTLKQLWIVSGLYQSCFRLIIISIRMLRNMLMKKTVSANHRQHWRRNFPITHVHTRPTHSTQLMASSRRKMTDGRCSQPALWDSRVSECGREKTCANNLKSSYWRILMHFYANCV